MLPLHPSIYARALDARDPRFDGVFFVGITTTRIYCRPVCAARVAYHDHRRFFNSAAAAERAGFRPCLRCRPELAPGLALVDAVSRLAQLAAQRIGIAKTTTLAFCEASVLDEEGQLCAHATGTFKYLRALPTKGRHAKPLQHAAPNSNQELP